MSDLSFHSGYRLPATGVALSGRDERMPVPERHRITGNPLRGPFAAGLEQAVFGMGCFWGVERLFWRLPGIFVTAVGYAGGVTPNPTYEEVCTGRTGHAEVVLVVFDPAVITYAELLRQFWEGHDPTQGMRQGNDVGSQYRSLIHTFGDSQLEQAMASREAFQQALQDFGYGRITTEILPASPFYYAEEYHQQYLEWNPGGYCGLAGTGVSCPTGLALP